MKLTDFEKEIVKAIYDGKASTVISFIKEFINPEIKQWPEAHYKSKIPGKNDLWYNISLAEPYYIIKNADDAIKKVKTFIEIMKYLDRKYLAWENSAPDINYWIFKKEYNGTEIPDPAYKLFLLVNSYRLTELVNSATLREFIENGYLTTEERRDIETREERKANQTTRIVAIGGLVVALGGLVFNISNAVYQSRTYKKDRTVTIVNPGAFQDTMKVLMVNPIILQTDTSKMGI